MKPYMSLFVDTPRAAQTAGEASTMLLAQGGCPAWSGSHPFSESHSSTTVASVDWPFPLIRILRPHRLPPLYHPVERATANVFTEWYLPSHFDGGAPSAPAPKSLRVRVAAVPLEEMGGEHDTFWHVLLGQHVSEFWSVAGHVLFCAMAPRSIDNVTTSAAASNVTSTHACRTIFRLEPRSTSRHTC